MSSRAEQGTLASERGGVLTICIGEEGYPQRLLHKLGKGCPSLFYYAGDLALLEKKYLAVVGSRAIDDAGRRFVERVVKTAVDKGTGIVSGGAVGTDSIARDVALLHGGVCIEYLADGLAAKAAGKECAEYIQAGRLLCLSAQKPDAAFRSAAALARNKYIWAQSAAGVVSRCDYRKGGSWQGAYNALRFAYAGVFVFNNKVSAGNQELIRLGACPVDENWAVEI